MWLIQKMVPGSVLVDTMMDGNADARIDEAKATTGSGAGKAKTGSDGGR